MTNSMTGSGIAHVDPRTLRRVTLGGSVGTYVELYDYAIYGFLASTIALVFFPGEGSDAALLMTYGVFGLTFAIRPLGGVVLGVLGDRIGRRFALVFAITLMTAATAGVGLLPTYAAVGIAAPILLLCMRLLQGFSAGGEAPAANSFVAEYAPSARRAWYTCFTQVGSFTALLTGALLAAGLTGLLGQDAMQAWGWRIPFLVALPIGVIGYYIRSRLQDSPEFRKVRESEQVSSNPIKETFTGSANITAIVLAILLPLLNGSGYYILFVYMPTYLSNSLDFSAVDGLLVTSVALVVLIVSMPFAARLSDRYGRRVVLAGSAFGLAVLAYPCYWVMTRGSLELAVIGAAVMACVFSGHTAIIHTALVELFPTRLRTTGYSIGYNVSTAIFGGGAPFLVTYLIQAMDNTSVPAYYVIATAIGTAIAALAMKETSRQPLRMVS